MTYGNNLSVAAQAAQSYFPQEPYPVVPPWTNYNNPNSALMTVNPPVFSTRTTNAAVVTSIPRRKGMRWLFSYGAQLKQLFHMRATGAVESSVFQPFLSHRWSAGFNDALYQAGYPRNLGLSEKVPNANYRMQGQEPFRSQPRPELRRTVYTRRSFASAPSVPARPQGA